MLYTRYHYATKTMRFKQLLHPCNAKPAHRSVLWHLGKACLPWGNLENLQSSDWGRKRICVKPDPVSCLDCIKIKYTMNLLAAVTSSSEFWVECSSKNFGTVNYLQHCGSNRFNSHCRFFIFKVRYNIPCHVTDVSCGKTCGKQLSCGHKCAKICHKVCSWLMLRIVVVIRMIYNKVFPVHFLPANFEYQITLPLWSPRGC